jgi:hypothetical protein
MSLYEGGELLTQSPNKLPASLLLAKPVGSQVIDLDASLIDV